MKTQYFGSRTFLCLTFILTLFACKGSADRVTPENLNLLDGDSIEIGYQESKTITFEGKQFNIFFEDVADGRCSRDVCYLCYGSFGKVKLVITSQVGDVEKTTLSIIGCSQNNSSLNDLIFNDDLVTLNHFKIGLASLNPYPIKERDSISKNAYKAKLIIRVVAIMNVN